MCITIQKIVIPLQRVRIVGNAEVRPMNVNTALTAEAGAG